MRREGGIKDEGTGKSMAEWNPAAIELFQLTLAEERGIPKHSLLTHSLLLFEWNYTTFITASHSSLCLCQFFHLSLPWGSLSFFIHETVPCVFFSPANLFENVKPCTVFVFLKNLWDIKICCNVASPFEKGFQICFLDLIFAFKSCLYLNMQAPSNSVEKHFKREIMSLFLASCFPAILHFNIFCWHT